MKDKICVITGATSGIGKEIALALTRQGATLALIVRSGEKGKRLIEDLVAATGNHALRLHVGDLTSQSEIRKLASGIAQEYPRVDVLINNAGLINPERSVTVDGIESTLALNHLAYFLLTALLREQLACADSARIVNVASEASRGGSINFDDLGFEKTYTAFGAYARSKLANILFTYELARRLAGSSVTANAVHPGSVRSSFGEKFTGLIGLAFRFSRPFMRSPKRGAQGAIWLASSNDVEGVTGKYFKDKREIRSAATSYDREIQGRLWEISENLTGVRW